ncbi:MAG: AI-2E family transporter [Acidobacteriota bacterium]
MQLDLSEKQRQAVRAAVTIVSGFIILLAAAAILWMIGAFFARFSSVFLPVAVAAVLALVFRPMYEFLHERMRLPAVLSLVGVFLALLLPIAGFSWFFGALAVEQIDGLIKATPETWRWAVGLVQERWPAVVDWFENSAFGQQVRSAVEGQQGTLVTGLQTGLDAALHGLGRVARGIGAVLTWAVLPVYFAFFLMAEPGRQIDLDHVLPFLKKETRENVVYLGTEFINIMVAFFRGQLIIAFLQGVLYAIGFSLVGLKYGLVLGLALGFLNIIPYLGSIVGLGVAIPLGFFQNGGGLWMIAAVLIVFTIVQMIEGYVLTPKVMGDRTGLHPMAIIIAVFFWGSALSGLAGMILAIPLTAFLVVFWRLAKEKYIDELV